MLPYKSPGVYVKEEPSAVQPIAGVGTSTAGFIGVVPNEITVPKSNPDYNPNLEEGETIEVAPTVEHLLGQKLVSNTLTLEAGTKLNEVQVKRSQVKPPRTKSHYY